MSERLDVIGIGNAMVDAIIPSDRQEIEKHEINRDSMNLIDENLKNILHQTYSIKDMVGGGSLGNSMFGITSLGGNGSFIGKIKNDKMGIFLQKDMISEGLKFPLGFTSPQISTGCCTIFVEEDGTRTMCTFLGAGSSIGPDDIKTEQVISHKIAYLEGYLWDNENAKKAMKKMVDICKKDNQQIAFTLSDLFCVDRHRDSFIELIKNDVDILFGNEEEVCALSKSNSISEGINYIKSLNITAAVTLAEKGSLIVKNNEIIEISAIHVDKVIDSTGAGDLFASGFLYGLSQNKELTTCGHIASIAAAEIISHYGARPLNKLSNLI
jgi:sugar/nucleoside kinase (ribokinase family)|tara:strand:+ start:4328 stop:5302 length:975 start_codon:yes stop_codon:yes gene_type:complete